ncbi:MAG: phage tail tape measure protein [Acidimicrobiales bacterium]
MKLFDLMGTISADTSPFERSMARTQARLAQLTTRMDRLSRVMSGSFAKLGGVVNGLANGLRSATMGTRGLYSALSLAAGVAGGFAVLRSAVTGASDLAESLSKVRTVFGDSTSVVTSGADEMARKFGVVKGEFIDAAANLGLVGKAAGMGQGEAAKMADGLARLALDASSFFNVPLAEALDSMRSGLVGESEPLRRFGVLLSEAAVKQEALTLGLAKGKGELSESAKVRARVSIITRQLADAQGDLARTSDGFSNQWKKLGGLMTNFLTSVGTKVLPVFQSLVSGVTSLMEDFGDFFEANSGVVTAWAARVASAFSLIRLAMRNLGDFRKLGVLVVQDKIAQGFAILSRVGKVIWDNLVYGAKTAATVLRNVFSGVGRYLGTLFDSLGKALASSLINAIVDFAGSPAMKALSALPIFGGQVAALQAIAGAGRVVPPAVAGDASGLTNDAIMRGVKEGPGGFDKVMDGLPSLGEEIQDLVQKLHNINTQDAITGMLGRARRAVQAIPKRALTPVEQLNADNRRLGNGLPVNTAGPNARGAQEQAARTLRARREREAREANRSQRRLRGADFGKVGMLANALTGGVEGLAKNLGAGGGVAKLIGMGATLGAFGLPGIVAGQQGGQFGRKSGARTGGMGGVAPLSKEFRSEFINLSDFSRRLGSDALSRGKNDPQVSELQSLNSAIGGDQAGGNTVRGLLMDIKKGILKAGPGFAI